VYAATKLAQEHICSAWTSAMAAKLTILRFQNVYGVGQSLTNGYTGVLTLFARRAVAGKVIPLFEDGKIIRDFVYVDDVVDSLAASIERPPDVMRRLDIGSGRASTLADVAAILAEAAGGPPPKVTGEFRDGDVRAASCDIAAAARELGYTPQWSLSDGLAALVDWARYNVRVAAA
jgi:dTDP-L-rhamnose 4-epimerase